MNEWMGDIIIQIIHFITPPAAQRIITWKFNKKEVIYLDSETSIQRETILLCISHPLPQQSSAKVINILTHL